MLANNQIGTSVKCPYCTSHHTSKRARLTSLGYATFHCHQCGRNYNERTGSPFNNLQYTTEIVFLVVLWRLRYKLSLRDLSQMFLERGFEFTLETVRDWEERFASLITAQLRLERKRDWKRKAAPSWHCDETYIKIKGQQFYLYRAIDKFDNLVDCRLSKLATWKQRPKGTRRFSNKPWKSWNDLLKRSLLINMLPILKPLKKY